MDEKLDQAIDESIKILTDHARNLAESLTPEKRQKIYSKMVAQEFEQFVNKIHYLNGLIGTAAESIKLGSSIGNVSYEIDFKTKQFETEEEAQEHLQQRKAELVSE